MTKPPVSIEIPDSNAESISISFSKEDFNQFFESLLSSPREQSETKFLGFDITLDDLRVIVEKMLMHVKVQNNLLKHNFTGQIFFSDGSDITEYSLDSFFGRSFDGMPKPIRFSASLKIIVGFNRDHGKLSYEQQNINFTLTSGALGSSCIRIRSTDFSWPQSIFLIYDKSIEELNRKINPTKIASTSKFLIFSPIFLKEDADHPFEHLVRNSKKKIESMKGLLTLSIFIFILAMYASLLVITFENSGSYLFNPEIQAFEPHVIDETELDNWESIAEKYRLSRELNRTGQFNFEGSRSYKLFLLRTSPLGFLYHLLL